MYRRSIRSIYRCIEDHPGVNSLLTSICVIYTHIERRRSTRRRRKEGKDGSMSGMYTQHGTEPIMVLN